MAPLTYLTTPTGTTNHSIEAVVGQPITHWVSIALTRTGRVKIAAPAHQNPALNYALLRAALHRLECVNHDCPDCAQHP